MRSDEREASRSCELQRGPTVSVSLHEVWRADSTRSASARVPRLALGPPPDWRETLSPRGLHQESFRSARVLDRGGRITA